MKKGERVAFDALSQGFQQRPDWKPEYRPMRCAPRLMFIVAKKENLMMESFGMETAAKRAFPKQLRYTTI